MSLRLAAAGCLFALPAAARVLQVGPGRAYPSPSAAAAAAQDGDSVDIAAGAYFDCAVWQASRLTIAGSGGAVVLTDRACEGKAAFVVRGDGVALRGLTFTRIRVPDGNGAGVRMEGRDLTVSDSRFINDQDGILAAGGGFLRIAGCAFTGDGMPAGPPTHAVQASGLDLLRIETSVFETPRGGDHIAATAWRIELDGNRLAGGGHVAGPLATLSGDVVVLTGNIVEPGIGERPGAVLLTGAARTLAVRGNTLLGPPGGAPLVRNRTGPTATDAGNHVPPGVVAVSDAGSAWHRLRAWMADVRDGATATAGVARHQVAMLARGLRLIP
jgi:hypothetical protein